MNTLLQRYSDNVLVRNLNKSLNEINLDDELHHYAHSSSGFELEHYITSLNAAGGGLQLWFWTRSFDEMFYHSVSFTDISSYLESLKSRFSESDIRIIEWKIYFILGPKDDADTENTTRFIRAYESGELYDFFGWEGFPLTHITSNPSTLSKIIVQHGQRYIHVDSRTVEIKERINLKDFDDEHICPPAKLLVYHLLNEPYDQKLLDESIDYFRGCPHEAKNGAFSILYKSLNPFKLT